MASARAEFEYKKNEIAWGLANRESLKSFCDRTNGRLFGPNSLMDIYRNMKSGGEVPLKMSPLCMNRTPGNLWKSESIIVLEEPVNEVLSEQVKDRTRLTPSEALDTSRIGGKVLCKESAASKGSFVERYFTIDLDDPDFFLALYEDHRFLKRVEAVSLDECSRAKFSFDSKQMLIPTKSGSLVILKEFQTDEAYYGLALVVAHTKNIIEN